MKKRQDRLPLFPRVLTTSLNAPSEYRPEAFPKIDGWPENARGIIVESACRVIPDPLPEA